MNIDSKIAKCSLFRFCQFARGTDLFKHLHNLDKTQWLSNKEIEEVQWTKLKKLLDYAYQNVPFYKKILNNIGLTPNDVCAREDFRRLPLLDKESIEFNISNITSMDYDARDLIENSTGGSTGRNLHFFNDKRRLGIRGSVVIRGNRWAGLDIGTNHAYLWGSPFDTSLEDTLKNKMYNKMVGCNLFLSSYDLSEKTAFSYAKKIQQYKPDVLIGYPSPLYFFAKYLNDNKIRSIHPKSIISSAEVLYDYQRELIEFVFGCKVFNRYGCREFSAIAQECSEHSGLHINAEHVYVECLKENGEIAAPGEPGELVVTDLDNYGMPFIRYRIGDRGILSDRKCNCGRGLPIMEQVEGRTFDIIVGTNGRNLGGTFWTLLLRTAVKGIKQFQVMQESHNQINIKIVVDDLFKAENLNILNKKIHEYCGEDMNVSFEFVDKIPLTRSGKFRFVISKVIPSISV